jgi:hypothetical protein
VAEQAASATFVGPASEHLMVEALTPEGVTPAGAESLIDQVAATVLLVSVAPLPGAVMLIDGGVVSDAIETVNVRTADLLLPALSCALTVNEYEPFVRPAYDFGVVQFPSVPIVALVGAVRVSTQVTGFRPELGAAS